MFHRQPSCSLRSIRSTFSAAGSWYCTCLLFRERCSLVHAHVAGMADTLVCGLGAVAVFRQLCGSGHGTRGAHRAIYDNQLQFAFRWSSAVFGAFCRWLLADGAGGVSIALFELLVALTAIAGAIFAQGELVGLELTLDTTPEAYDLFHGCWHVLLGTVAAVVYARVADASLLVDEGSVRCVCGMPALDWIGEIILLLLAVSVLVLKEAEVDLIVAQAIIGGCAGLGLLHAVATLAVYRDRFFGRGGFLAVADV